jgi:RNA-directed DNA polymerase
VTYADDLVILCRRGKGEEALQRLREIMGKLKLTVNEEKTRICKVPEGGYGYHPSGYGGAAAIGAAAVGAAVAAPRCWINSYGTQVCN